MVLPYHHTLTGPPGPTVATLLLFYQSLLHASSENVMVFNLSSGVTVGFERLSYTVAEDEILELCIMFRGLLRNDSFLELNISLLSESAGSKLNYCVVCI